MVVRKAQFTGPLNSPGRLAASLVLALALAACTTLPGRQSFSMPGIDESDGPSQVWPPQPAVPRYAFIGHIRGESNRRQEPLQRSGLERIMAAIVGLDSKQSDTLDLVRPQQVVSDNNGRIFVTDPGLQSIFVFDENLGEFEIWNERSLDIALPSPIGIAFAENFLWVTDSELALIYQLNLEGKVVNRFGQDWLQRPTGISYDADRRRFYVSDTAAGDIKLFDSRGEWIETWGAAGSGEGQFNRPTYLYYRDSQIYVVDSLNARVQILDAQGRFVQTVGQRGLYVGYFSRPKGIALDSDGNIYVSESYYDHLLIYNSRGELLMSVGGSGAGDGQFLQPTGLWVDDRDRVYVSDMLNSRISMFQYLGNN
jgi:DNA-binding beta-propeller fold protein YncE